MNLSILQRKKDNLSHQPEFGWELISTTEDVSVVIAVSPRMDMDQKEYSTSLSLLRYAINDGELKSAQE